MDLGILIGIVVCQALAGYMGFHVSVTTLSDTDRNWYRVAFLALTTIGVGLVIWSGVRSMQVQDQILGLLINGPPKLSIVDIDHMDAVAPTEYTNLRFDIYLRNIGQGQACCNTESSFTTVAPLVKMKAKFIDKVFDIMREQAPLPDPRTSSWMLPNSTDTFISLDNNLTLSQYETVNQHNVLWILFLVRWIDKDSRQEWAIEHCYFWWPNTAFHICPWGNHKIGPFPIPKATTSKVLQPNAFQFQRR